MKIYFTICLLLFSLFSKGQTMTFCSGTASIPAGWVIISVASGGGVCSPVGEEITIQNIQNMPYGTIVQHVCGPLPLPQDWYIISEEPCYNCCQAAYPSTYQFDIKKIDLASMPTGSELTVCSISTIPSGWVVIEVNPFPCCSCTPNYSYKIKKVDCMPIGSTLTMCAGLPIPSGWTTISSQSCSVCCPNNQDYIIQKISGDVKPNVTTFATSTSICLGDYTIMSATGADLYTWMPGANIGNYYAVAPLSTTTYTVTGISSLGGCSDLSTRTITVMPNVTPSVSINIINGSNPSCVGSSLTFAATPTNGGTPSYQWKLNGINVGSNSPNYTTSSLINGQIITCVLTPSGICASPTTAISNAITINVITPTNSIAITSGSNPSCSGSPVTFTATSTNGGAPSYQWKVNGINVGTNSPTLTTSTLSNGQNVSCILTTSGICANPTFISSNNIVMTINANPSGVNAGLDKTLNCSNPSAIIGTSAVAGYSYLWSPPAGLNSVSIAQPIANPITTTNYTVTATNSNGCKATDVVIVNANVTPAYANAGVDKSLNCTNPSVIIGSPSISGQTYSWSPAIGLSSTSISQPTVTVSSPTIYTVTATNSFGCTATDIVIIYPVSTTNITVCDSYFWVSSGVTYTTSGSYSIGNGCSAEVLNLIVNSNSNNGSNTVTACNSYQWNGLTYTTSGTYTYTTMNIQGCINSAILNLTINYSNVYTNETKIACDSYLWNGLSYTASGIYTKTLNSGSGCPTIATLNLTINSDSATTYVVDACNSFNYNGITYTSSGTYTNFSTTNEGCLKTVILDLTINYNTSSTSMATSCDSYTWNENGMSFNTTGVYTYTSINANGCTNNATLHLSIGQSTQQTTIVSSCGSYLWHGTTYTTSGTYYYYDYNLINATGCLASEELQLTIGSAATAITANACGSYTWALNNQTYTSSGIYTTTFAAASGCSLIATLTLTINNPTTFGGSTVTTCNSYVWNGGTYNSSGNYTFISMNSQGCVNTATLNLTINNNSTAGSINISACDSYTWPATGLTYTISGVYTKMSLNAFGCLNTATLNLTINHTSSSSITVTACNSTLWNGNTYTSSGIYTYTTMNPSGCLDSSTMFLTINNSSVAGSATVTSCNSYTWGVTGLTYTQSGVFVRANLNANGCMDLATLNLTIGNPITGSSTITACNSYTWNGSTYTSSGTYTFTSVSSSGCIDSSTLILTINSGNTTNGNSTVIVCDSYLWNGATYTESGIYTFTSLNAQSCINTATLSLTINHSSTTGSISTAACNSYIWPVTGLTYTTSGIYSYTTLNAQGCINTATLNLTIYTNTSTTSTITACNSYLWNGTTYTSSGTYTFTSLNLGGCIITSTLFLTINSNSSTGNATVTSCGTYSWNGTTYTASGVYTHTSLNGLGCINTATLDLTINIPPNIGIIPVIAVTCSGVPVTISANGAISYTWMPGSLNGSTISITPLTTTTYTVTATSISGCTSSATRLITVNQLPTLTATSNSTQICPGTSIILSSNGANSYTWVPGLLTGSSVSVSPVLSTTYTVTGTNTNGCTSIKTVPITVFNAPPPITTGGSRCGPGIVNLSATGSGTLSWYDAATGGSIVNNGTSYSPTISTTTTYYVSNSQTFSIGSLEYIGPVSKGIGSSLASSISGYLLFDVTQVCTLQSVVVYPNAAGNVILEQRNSNGTVILNTTTITVSASQIGTAVTMNLNWPLTVGTGYRLYRGSSGVSLFRNSSGVSYPYTGSNLSITGSVTGSASSPAFYYWAYNWVVSGLSTISCTSTRTPVSATVDCNTTLSLNLFLQGYYIGANSMTHALMNEGVNSNSTIADTIVVELRDAVSPYGIAATTKAILNTSGSATCTFPSISGNYYVAVKHRNGLQTWSKLPISITGLTASYDFTAAASKAYGDNQVQVENGIFAMYSGDVNLDENIDLLDESILELDINSFQSGYFSTDLNGDGNVDLIDFPYLENNVNDFIFSIHP